MWWSSSKRGTLLSGGSHMPWGYKKHTKVETRSQNTCVSVNIKGIMGLCGGCEMLLGQTTSHGETSPRQDVSWTVFYGSLICNTDRWTLGFDAVAIFVYLHIFLWKLDLEDAVLYFGQIFKELHFFGFVRCHTQIHDFCVIFRFIILKIIQHEATVTVKHQ